MKVSERKRFRLGSRGLNLSSPHHHNPLHPPPLSTHLLWLVLIQITGQLRRILSSLFAISLSLSLSIYLYLSCCLSFSFYEYKLTFILTPYVYLQYQGNTKHIIFDRLICLVKKYFKIQPLKNPIHFNFSYIIQLLAGAAWGDSTG